MKAPQLSAPQPLSSAHRLDSFDCGEATLDDWLKRRALANQITGASRTFVVCDAEQQVIGYYALAAGAISHAQAGRSIRQNMPDPIPVLVLGRLAVDRRAQGLHLGAALLQNAVQRAGIIAEHAGIRALLVHALNDKARAFYQYYGFQPSPVQPMTLLLRLRRNS